jgi:DNA-binding transcriptional LysR family regulator
LEQWIGAELVDRRSVPVRPTEAGLEFMQIAEEIVCLVHQAQKNARMQSGGDGKQFRLSTCATLAETFVPKWIKGLMPHISVKHIGVRTDFRCLNAYLEGLCDGTADAFMGYEDRFSSNLIDDIKFPSILLSTDVLVPVAKRGIDDGKNWWLPSVAGRTVPLIQYVPEGHFHEVIRHHPQKRQVDLQFTTVFEARYARVLKAMAIEGFGVAWLPRALIKEAMESGELVRAADPSWDIPLCIRLYRYCENRDPRIAKLWRQLDPDQPELGNETDLLA